MLRTLKNSKTEYSLAREITRGKLTLLPIAVRFATKSEYAIEVLAISRKYEFRSLYDAAKIVAYKQHDVRNPLANLDALGPAIVASMVRVCL